MAVDRGTLQTIGLLNSIIDKQANKAQRDEGRAMQLLSLRVQSDERELDRVNRRLGAMQDEVFRMERDFAKLSGVQKRVDNISASTGEVTDAGSIVDAERTRMASDRDSMLSEINSLAERRQALLGRAQEYYTGYNQALDKYETARQLDPSKTLRDQAVVSESEMAQLINQMAKDRGAPVSQDEIAGIKAKFQELMSGTFDQLDKERNFQLRRKMANQKKTSGSGPNLDVLRKDVISRYRQLKSKLEDTNREFEITDGGFMMPDVDSGATNLSEGMNALAGNLVEMATKYNDSAIPEKYQSLMSEYKKLRNQGDTEGALSVANDLMRAVSKDVPSLVGNMDYSSWPWPFNGENREHKEYAGDLIRGYQTLQEYQDELDAVRAINDPQAMQRLIKRQAELLLEQEEESLAAKDALSDARGEFLVNALKSTGYGPIGPYPELSYGKNIWSAVKGGFQHSPPNKLLELMVYGGDNAILQLKNLIEGK